MRIIGCDLHARQQTLAMLETIAGETVSLTLPEGNNVREFYSQLARSVVGIEATETMHTLRISSALQTMDRWNRTREADLDVEGNTRRGPEVATRKRRRE